MAPTQPQKPQNDPKKQKFKKSENKIFISQNQKQVLNPQKGVSGPQNLETSLFEKLENRGLTDRQNLPIKSPHQRLKITMFSLQEYHDY